MGYSIVCCYWATWLFRDDKDDKGQVRVIGGKLLPYELNHSPTDACQSLQLPH